MSEPDATERPAPQIDVRPTGALTETGWHHHGDRHVFGSLLDGRAVVEFATESRDGTTEVDRLAFAAPDFFHVPPRTVHRDGNRGKVAQVSVSTFVGAGHVVVTVDDPEAE